MWTRIFLIAAVITSIAARYSVVIIEDPDLEVNVFYLLQSVAWALILVTVRTAVQSKITQILCDGFIVLAISEVMDEIWFMPTKLQINELMLLILVSTFTLYRIIKNVINDRRKQIGK